MNFELSCKVDIIALVGCQNLLKLALWMTDCRSYSCWPRSSISFLYLRSLYGLFTCFMLPHDPTGITLVVVVLKKEAGLVQETEQP